MGGLGCDGNRNWRVISSVYSSVLTTLSLTVYWLYSSAIVHGLDRMMSSRLCSSCVSESPDRSASGCSTIGCSPSLVSVLMMRAWFLHTRFAARMTSSGSHSPTPSEGPCSSAS